MKLNKQLSEQIEKIKTVASLLDKKGWVEATGGNISLDLTRETDEELILAASNAIDRQMMNPFPNLPDRVIYFSGKGRRMRDVAREPLEFGSIIKLSSDGHSYKIISDNNVLPTSELLVHLKIHEINKGHFAKAVIHAHPSKIIALTHWGKYFTSKTLTDKMWSMLPEVRIALPSGIGVIPYLVTGSESLAEESAKAIMNHDILVWEKHGVLSAGHDLEECFDKIEILAKAAEIYIMSLSAGFEPDGLSGRQLDELADSLGL